MRGKNWGSERRAIVYISKKIKLHTMNTRSKLGWNGLTVLTVVLAALLSGVIALGRAADAKKTQTKAPSIPADVEAQRDVVYGNGGDVPLKMDIYRPKSLPGGPLPVIVYIHGGDWSTGSKEDGAEKLLPYVQRGYCGVSINYRLTPLVQFPAPLEDCKCAIRYLRTKAKDLNLDPDHIGIWGDSAGGHLAALVGSTSHVKEFEGNGGSPGVSSRVQAVCAQGAPVEFVTLLQETHTKQKAEPAITALLGGPLKERRN